MPNPLFRESVTVIEPTTEPGSLCDFCLEWLGDHYTRFGARPFTRHPSFAVVVSLSGAWAACPTCAPLVRARKWVAVLDRTMHTWRGIHGPDHCSKVRAEIGAAYLQLEQHLTGEETEIGGAA